MALSRLKTGLLPCARGTGVHREFKIGPAANRILTALLRAEVRLTMAGMRWPFGGSRIVAARAV